MEQYNDLFGFDRFMQAQNMAREWDRQNMLDQRQLDQDAYTRRQDTEKNALALIERENKGKTRNALLEAYEMDSMLRGMTPEEYNEGYPLAVARIGQKYPGADLPTVGGVFKERKIEKPEAVKYTERDKPVGKNLFQREYRDETTGGKWLPLGERYEKSTGTKISIGGGKTLPAGQLESLADMEQVKRQLSEAKTILDSGKVDTGPISGRYQSVVSKLGGAEPEFVQLKQKLSTAENIMLKLRSGAAVTQSEYERFLNEYPNVNDSPEVAKAKAANAVAYANELLNLKIQTYKEGGYKTPQNIGMGQEVAPGITILSIEDAP